MSIKKWEELAQQKRAVETQRQSILNAFKERKVKDEMGNLVAEKLFKPVTKRMEKIPEAEGFEGPDYDIDDQTRIFKNVLPFDEGEYEYKKEQRVPDYPLPAEDLEEDILLAEDIFPEEFILPEEEKQITSPRSAPPDYSPPPSYSKIKTKEPESVDLGIL